MGRAVNQVYFRLICTVVINTTQYNTKDKQQLTHLDTCYLNHEHRSTQHMSSIVAPEFDSSDLSLLVKVHSLNAVHAGLDILLSVQHLICGNVAHFHIVRQQPTKHKDTRHSCYKHNSYQKVYF